MLARTEKLFVLPIQKSRPRTLGICVTTSRSHISLCRDARFATRSDLLNCNSRWCVSDPLPPSAALPLTEGENKSNLPFVRGRRERSERGGRSHTILNSWLQSPEPL